MPAGHSRDRASRTVANIHAGGELVPLVRFGPFELDAIHLLLRGTSVVDWYRLHFNDREDIEAFIRLNEFDLRRAEDRKHIAGLKARALDYLRDHLRYRRVPERIAEADIVELIEFASGRGRRAYRFYACLVLKVIHLMHYVAGHELVGSLPITQAEVAVLLRAKVERVVRGLLERKFPLVAFSGNTKTHNSVLSKLMAKRESQAAQVFDKLRFRFVVDRLEDVPPLLIALIRELVPFNYTVPDQAKNTLVDLPAMLVRAGNLHVIRARQGESSQQKDSSLPVESPLDESSRPASNQQAEDDLNEPLSAFETGRRNELSGPGYRVVNFIAEVPIRLDDVIWEDLFVERQHGPVGFGTIEFQVIDKATAHRNETGPNRHALYKGRQRSRVRNRLERGKRGLMAGGPIDRPLASEGVSEESDPAEG